MNEWTEEQERKKLFSTAMKKNPNPWKQQAKERCELWYERQTAKDSSFLSLLSHTHKHFTWVSNGVNWESLFLLLLLQKQKIHSDIFCLLHPTNDKLGCLYTKNLILSSPQISLCLCLYLSDVWWHDYPKTVNSNILNHG